MRLIYYNMLKLELEIKMHDNLPRWLSCTDYETPEASLCYWILLNWSTRQSVHSEENTQGDAVNDEWTLHNIITKTAQ